MVKLRTNPLVQSILKYTYIDKDRMKKLKQIEIDLCDKYPNITKGLNELYMQKEDGSLDFEKLNDYQRIAYALDFVYELEGLNIIPLLNNKPNSTSHEICELINIWINCNGQVDPLNYDVLYSYIIVATKLRRLLETYKVAKKIYFRDIADKDKLLEQDALVNKILQEKHDLEAKFNKTKTIILHLFFLQIIFIFL